MIWAVRYSDQTPKIHHDLSSEILRSNTKNTPWFKQLDTLIKHQKYTMIWAGRYSDQTPKIHNDLSSEILWSNTKNTPWYEQWDTLIKNKNTPWFEPWDTLIKHQKYTMIWAGRYSDQTPKIHHDLSSEILWSNTKNKDIKTQQCAKLEL